MRKGNVRMSVTKAKSSRQGSGFNLIAPYGGTLVDLRVPAEEFEAAKAHANRLPSIGCCRITSHSGARGFPGLRMIGSQS